jgi:hypothetical protein
MRCLCGGAKDRPFTPLNISYLNRDSLYTGSSCRFCQGEDLVLWHHTAKPVILYAGPGYKYASFLAPFEFFKLTLALLSTKIAGFSGDVLVSKTRTRMRVDKEGRRILQGGLYI